MKLNELNNLIKDFEFEGDKTELLNILNSHAHIIITLKDIISILSHNRTNYIKTGYGQNLLQAYQSVTVNGTKCKLIHIYSHPDNIKLHELHNFVSTEVKDAIFGITFDNMTGNKVKLSTIFN
ncbi:MAG: hypothetical protein HDR74_07415 [Bacteroides sp.]|nr:hypothetical protein [Bacteroides sp.]MDE5810217.1 hypothetical protein [Muribaculaceae bacterium]